MFKDLYVYLRNSGFMVYSLGQQDKTCTEPFILFYDAGVGETTSKNLKREYIELWLFYPYGRYSEVNSYIKSVQDAISNFGKLRSNYENANAIQIDNDMTAYYTKLSYYRFVQRRYK